MVDQKREVTDPDFSIHSYWPGGFSECSSDIRDEDIARQRFSEARTERHPTLGLAERVELVRRTEVYDTVEEFRRS